MSLALFYAMQTGDAVALTHCHARCTCGCPPIVKTPLSVDKGDILYHENYAFLTLELKHDET